MKEAYYFSHDSNARNDKKILKLRSKLGFEGYGIFWALIEMLRDEDDYRLNLDYETISYGLNNADIIIVKSVIEDFGLFVIEDGVFYSNRLIRSMEEKAELSEKRRQSRINYLQKLEKATTNIEQNNNKSATNGITKNGSTPTNIEQIIDIERKGKEKKGKEKKENNNLPEIEISGEEKNNGFNDLEPPEDKFVSLEGKDYAKYFKTLLPESQKVTNSDLINWAKTFDDLMKIDCRSPDEIYKVSEWARKDEFWESNFLSARKLRNKDKNGVMYYDIFLKKMNNGVNLNGKPKLIKPEWL